MDSPQDVIVPKATTKGSKKWLVFGAITLLVVAAIAISFTVGFLLGKEKKESDEEQEQTQDDTAKSCTYEEKTYKHNEGFPSSDGCNSCSCLNGEVVCTLMACINEGDEGQGSAEPLTEYNEVTLFFVAQDDNGASGKLIGCGDSLVGITSAIDPTNDPVDGALQKLLSIDEQYYGESGLLNSLYQSDLTLENVVKSGSTLNVYLTGEIVTTGTCDIPRVTEQLTETAKQISGITNVEIFVNGEAIDDVLSLRG